MGRSVSIFKLKADEQAVLKKGLEDSLNGVKPDWDPDGFRSKLQEMARGRQSQAATAEKERAKAFLEKAAKETGAQQTASGLIYKETTPGTGASPVPTDRVKVHYHGTLADGTVFDSSVQRGEPIAMPLNGVIRCWTEGVSMMKVGGKSKLVCPSDIAYGDQGRPPVIKGGATLVFEVELLEIVK